MFRRKDENATDGSSDSADNSTMSQASGTGSESAGLPSSLTSAANPYAPGAQSYSPARPAASTSNYRPAPLADFARSSSANPARSETQRPAAPVATSSAVPSFSALSDKSSQKANRRVLTVGNDILLNRGGDHSRGSPRDRRPCGGQALRCAYGGNR